jgi:hypothetical protein
MSATIRDGDCVRLPDGRVARVRAKIADGFKVRVRWRTSNTHQFPIVAAGEVERVDCPTGWMSPEGYRRYLEVMLAKMREPENKPRDSKSRFDIR